MKSLSEIAVIGGSAAGVAAVCGMRAQGFEGSITLYDSDTRLPYERPPLSKGLVGDGVMIKPICDEKTYVDAAVDLALGRDVVGVTNREVSLADGSTRAYDGILVATGVAARRLDVPGADLNHVLQLRNAHDAEALESRMQPEGPSITDRSVAPGGSVSASKGTSSRTFLRCARSETG